MADQKSAQDYFSEARLFLMQGRLQEASESLRDGLRRDPTYQPAWMNLGVVHKELGDYAASERCFLQAKALNQNDGNTWFNLGSLYLRQLGRIEDALTCLQEAMRLSSDDEDAVSFTAEALVKLGRWGEATQLLDQAIEKRPDWMNVLQTREALTASFRQFLENIARSDLDTG